MAENPLEAIINYYNECYPYYKIGWRSHKNLCIHYGFHDKGQGHDEALIRMIEVLADKAKVTSRDKVLDAGCGVGGSSIWLAKNIGCRVIGIDINQNFISTAKGVAGDRGLGKLVHFYTMDFCHPRFPNGVFDVIGALESSCYAKDKQGFLAEMSRLLKPGGRLVIADGYKNQDTRGLDIALKGWAVPNIPTVTEFSDYLNKAGFNNVSYEDISNKVAPSSMRIYRIGVVLYPLAKLLKLLRLKTEITINHTLSAIYQRRLGVSGLGQYGIFTAEKAS